MLKFAFYVLLSIFIFAGIALAFGFPAFAQSVPAATGDGPSWGWVAVFVISLLVVALLFIANSYSARMSKLERDMESTTRRLDREHLDKNDTRKAIREGIAVELPNAILTIQTAIIAALGERLNSQPAQHSHIHKEGV
jgi:hypothetical protein